MKSWNITKKKLSELKPADYNPRKISEDELRKLEKSIVEYGYVEPIIFNKVTGKVVGGHQRLKALEGLGYEEVDVVEVELDEQKEKSLNLALNKISGEWDLPKLSALLEEFPEDFDYDLTGFDDKEIEKIIKKNSNLDFELGEHEEEKDLFNHSQKSHVKMVQLFFNEKTHKPFLDKINKLAKTYGTKNVTDTIDKAVDNEIQNNPSSKPFD